MKKTKLVLILMIVMIFLIAFISCGGANDGNTPEPTPDENIVVIKNYKFNPAEITIKSGETITWINMDGIRHTATNDIFDSGLLRRNESFQFTLNEAGTYDYICTPHPYMKGKIIVE